MNLIGISGKAGSGKDTLADWLVENKDFVKVSLADVLKRACKEFFDFSDEQLWGPSEKRNKLDKRYVMFYADIKHMLNEDGLKEFPDGKVPQYLTPRHALQQLGTEFGRACYPNVWIDYTIRIAEKLLCDENYRYSQKRGLFIDDISNYPCVAYGVVVADVRFANEVGAIKKAGGRVIRVKRPNAGLEGEAAQHQSEAEMATMPDELFDVVVNNEGTLNDLYKKAEKLF